MNPKFHIPFRFVYSALVGTPEKYEPPGLKPTTASILGDSTPWCLVSNQAAQGHESTMTTASIPALETTAPSNGSWRRYRSHPAQLWLSFTPGKSYLFFKIFKLFACQQEQGVSRCLFQVNKIDSCFWFRKKLATIIIYSLRGQGESFAHFSRHMVAFLVTHLLYPKKHWKCPSSRHIGIQRFRSCPTPGNPKQWWVNLHVLGCPLHSSSHFLACFGVHIRTLQKKEGPFSFSMLCRSSSNLHQPKHANHSRHPSRHVPNSWRRDFPRWNVTSWNWMSDSAAGLFANIRIIH